MNASIEATLQSPLQLDASTAIWIAAILLVLLAVILYIAYRQLLLTEQLNKVLFRSPRLVVSLTGSEAANEKPRLEPYVSAHLAMNCTFDLWVHNLGNKSDHGVVLRLWIPIAYQLVEHWGGVEPQQDASILPGSGHRAYRIPLANPVRPGLPEQLGRFGFTDMPGLDPIRLEWELISDFGKHPPDGRGTLDLEFAPPQS